MSAYKQQQSLECKTHRAIVAAVAITHMVQWTSRDELRPSTTHDFETRPISEPLSLTHTYPHIKLWGAESSPQDRGPLVIPCIRGGSRHLLVIVSRNWTPARDEPVCSWGGLESKLVASACGEVFLMAGSHEKFRCSMTWRLEESLQFDVYKCVQVMEVSC